MSTPARDSSPASPLRYRSARAVGADPATDPAQVLTRALDLQNRGGSNSVDRETGRRLLIGLAQRPDLPRPVLNRLCEAVSWPDWQIILFLVRNPEYRKLPVVQDLFHPDLLPALLPHIEEFPDDVLRLVGRNTDVYRANFNHEWVTQIQETLGEERITAILTAWVRRGGMALRDAIECPLITDAVWTLLLNKARQQHRRGSDQNGTLLALLTACRTLTPARAMALIDLLDDIQASHWVYLGLVHNSARPLEVFDRLVLHSNYLLAHEVLAHRDCPDRARIEAARRHRPIGLSKMTRGLPADVAHIVLADLQRGKAGRRVIKPADAAVLRRALARLSDDPDIVEAILPAYLDGADTVAGGVENFFADATDEHWTSVPNLLGDSREDQVLAVLARSSHAEARAFVVPFLISEEDVLLAYRDPAPQVRAAAAGHPLMPGDVLGTIALTDPDPNVRRMAVTRPQFPGDVLHRVAEDPDETVRDAVATRFLGMMVHNLD